MLRWGWAACALVLGGVLAWHFLPARPFLILAVGESTTLDSGPESWTRLLETRLREACPRLRPVVKTFAVGGAYTSDIAARMGAGLAIYRPRAVITMTGANDHDDIAEVTPSDLAFFGAPYESEAAMEEAILRRNLSAEPLKGREYFSRFLQPYLDSGRVAEGRSANERVLAAHPGYADALGAQALLLGQEGKEAEAQEWLAKLRAADSPSLDVRLRTLELNRTAAALDAENARLRKIFPKSVPLSTMVARLYLFQGRWREAEAEIRYLLEFAPGEERRRALYALAESLWSQGKHRAALRVPVPGGPVGRVATQRNYRRIAEQVRASGASLFPMQYPLRDPAPLRAWVGDLAETVISNREPFLAAADLGHFGEYFSDRFGGDIGHFNGKAQALVAESAASALLPWLHSRYGCGQ